MIPQIGDFVAVALVAAKVINALNSSRGSKSEFISILKTLSALSQALWQAEALWMDFQTTTSEALYHDKRRLERLNSIATDMNRERGECTVLISQFLNDLKSYKNAFIHPTAGTIRQVVRSLSWIGEKERIAQFEKRLDGHLKAFQMHLGAFCWTTMKSDMADSGAMLNSIDQSMGQLTIGTTDMQHKMDATLTKLGEVQTAMPTELGYCWGPEQPILLLDGLGRKTSLPVMFAATPDVFRDVLLIMHRGLPGLKKIEHGKYIVSDEDQEGALVQQDTWHESFQPGRHIALSFLLKYPGIGDDRQCPRCNMFKNRPAEGGRITCTLCNLTFRVEDRERTRQFWKDRQMRPKPPPRPASPSRLNKPTSNSTKHSHSHHETVVFDDEHDHEFLRVHYQRDILRRGSAELPWRPTDPAFEKMLTVLPPFFRAAASGAVDDLDELLEEGADINMPWELSDSPYRHDRTGWDFTGAPPIHFAAYYGHKEAVLFLLSNDADIEGRDSAGTTPLHAAAWTGNERLFKTLLRKGADISAQDHDGWGAAVYATSQGQEGITRLLLANSGGDMKALLKANTLRHDAKLGHADAVLRMLSKENPDFSSEDDTVKKLLLDQSLVGAAEAGHEELVQKLLERGADPAATDGSGSTAMHWAAWGGHTEVGNLKHDQEHELDDKSESEHQDLSTPQIHLDPDYYKSHHHESVMRMLLNAGADINGQNSQGCTALHWVSGAGSAAMISFLLANGADRDMVDNSGRSALDRAVGTGDRAVVRLLQPD